MTNQIPEILINQASEISLSTFAFNLILSALLSSVLSWVYSKYGRSLSNRSQFSENFFILTMTTMVIITVIKSSLALSLGLVGALSIIRFRTAVKEAEELAYLFLAISIGLGLGANQTKVTLLALTIITIAIIIHNKFKYKRTVNKNMILNIEGSNKNKISDYSEILKNNCTTVNLKRSDLNKSSVEASFIVEFSDLSNLEKIQDSLYNLDENISVTFIDNKGLFN